MKLRWVEKYFESWIKKIAINDFALKKGKASDYSYLPAIKGSSVTTKADNVVSSNLPMWLLSLVSLSVSMLDKISDAVLVPCSQKEENRQNFRTHLSPTPLSRLDGRCQAKPWWDFRQENRKKKTPAFSNKLSTPQRKPIPHKEI